MPYIENRMSVNAANAYNRGLFTRSKVTKEFLNRYGWTYSVSFFKWLCKKGYIKANEFHHTTPMKKSTLFYDPTVISLAINFYDLDSLYQLYLKKKTKNDILKQKGVSRVRILVSGNLMHTKNNVTLDCIQYKNQYWWSTRKRFRINTPETQLRLIDRFEFEDLNNWHNPNKKKIERRIYMSK